MPIEFNGKTYPLVSNDKMTPGEIDAVERVTGLTFQKIRYMGSMCVCDHNVGAHTHRDEEGRVTDDSSCLAEGCPCGAHAADLPTRVSTAFVWVAIKRSEPTTTFEQINSASVDELKISATDEDAAVDPTQPSQSEE